MIKLMYITNQPWVASIAEEAGVDWIFIDMEWIGKDSRQKGLDTVQNHHKIDDIYSIKRILKKAGIIVRVNPIHRDLADYPSSGREIESAIQAGADIIMLPYFKTVNEVQKFISIVNGRARTCLLLETAEAVAVLDEILEIQGIDMIHIGLNDLHLSLHLNFMFELLANGMVEMMASKIKMKGIPFGFGGIALMDKGVIPGEMILREHVRLGSQMAIVSRSFCNTDIETNPQKVKDIFVGGIRDLRNKEAEARNTFNYFSDNMKAIQNIVKSIQQ